ncbi:arsenate reductase (glutaredoxin) [Alteromonas sp. ASW11-36]|uniref:Arsenate reductase n=1 Tax=Alteromonas arenosi TaxID=3055817 RepID=A0ABT7SX88_9ALTE|nr:arsenate reductase (glutaredoxin) [Alteromonas sp. ASW11-36]MDM7860776.1 arsenate reductase (glutaredoxin) [Alteromonas sp. ASW11-36]
MSMQYLHNPRCSKSRQGLALLQENGVSPQVVEYLKTPLSLAELETLASRLGVDDVRQMMRVKEAEYKDNQLKDANQAELLQAMANFPKLIERPVLINGDKAIIGRPPEQLLEIV